MNSYYPSSFGSGGTVSFNISETPESLRKRAKQIEKAAKAEKRRQRILAERRQVAIDALVRVASDPKRGYASVTAAQALLALEERV